MFFALRAPAQGPMSQVSPRLEEEMNEEVRNTQIRCLEGKM